MAPRPVVNQCVAAKPAATQPLVYCYVTVTNW